MPKAKPSRGGGGRSVSSSDTRQQRPTGPRKIRKGAGLEQRQRKLLEGDIYEESDDDEGERRFLEDVGTAEPDGLPEGFEDEDIASDDEDVDDDEIPVRRRAAAAAAGKAKGRSQSKGGNRRQTRQVDQDEDEEDEDEDE